MVGRYMVAVRDIKAGEVGIIIFLMILLMIFTILLIILHIILGILTILIKIDLHMV